MRIATYNIRFGGTGRETLITTVLNQLSADAVILAEASDRAVVNTLASNLGMELVLAKGQRTSIALLSRLPPVSWGIFAPAKLKRPLLEATLANSTAGAVTLYGLHLQPHYFRRDENRRVLELQTYLSFIRSRQTGPHLLLGDFNAIARGDQINKAVLPLKERFILWWERQRIYHEAIDLVLKEGYSDCFRTLHPEDAGFTVPTHAPKVRLDYIFADSRLRDRLLSCDVMTRPPATRIASDHYPVLAEFNM